MKFNVDQLIGRIQTQRDEHQQVFNDAVEVYRKELLAQVESYVIRVKKGELVLLIHHLPVPEEHTKDFDLILDMLNSTRDETIELNKNEFDCYVRGNWGWKTEFTNNTVSYANKKLG